MIKNRFLLILARTMDHRIGLTDQEKPDLPILTVEEALISFFLRLLIVLVNFTTCGFVIANVIRHW
jgi:hypothetical protein